MANQDEDEKQEKRALGNLMSNKDFRTFIRYQVLEPCAFFRTQSLGSEARNGAMIELRNLAQDIVENIKFANIEGYFEMVREQVLEDEEQQQTDEGKE